MSSKSLSVPEVAPAVPPSFQAPAPQQSNSEAQHQLALARHLAQLHARLSRSLPSHTPEPAPIDLQPLAVPGSLLPSTPSHVPHPQPQHSGRYLHGDWGGVTVGKAQGVGTSPDPQGRYVRLTPSSDGASLTVGSHRTQGETGKRTGHAVGAQFDWNDLTKSTLTHSFHAGGPGKSVDEDGDLANGREISTRLGADGLQVAMRTAHEENKRDTSLNLTPDGVGAKHVSENEDGKGWGASLGIGPDRIDAGVEVKPFNNVSVGAGVHAVNTTTGGRSTNTLLDRKSWEVMHTTGAGADLSLGYDGPGVGLGVSGGLSERQAVAFQESEAQIRADFDPKGWNDPRGLVGKLSSWDEVEKHGLTSQYLAQKYGDRVEGVTSMADVALGRMQSGQGYSFQSERGSSKGVSGRAGLFSASFGDQDLGVTKTSIARQDKGWKISLQTADSDQDLVGAAVAGVGGREVDTQQKARGVDLTVDDTPAGREALRRFQQTGLLPGADQLADPKDPARQKYQTALDAFEATRKLLGDENAHRLLGANLYEASAPLNARALGADGKRLLEAPPSSTTYTGHTTSDTDIHESSVTVAGRKIVDAGLTETQTDRYYRGQEGVELELDDDLRENLWLGEDETTSVRVNPEGLSLGGQEIELAMRSRQPTDAPGRRLLDQIGAKGMDPEMRRAWADGEVHDHEQERLNLMLTGEQLDVIRDRLGPKGDDMAQLVADARYGLDVYGSVNLNLYGHKTATAKLLMSDQKGLFEGTDKAKAVLGKVRTDKDFLALSPEDKRLVAVAAAQGAQHRDEWKEGSQREDAQPWRVLPLVLQVEDPKERAELVRSVFGAVEDSSLGSTRAVVQMIEFLQQDGKLAGLTDAEIRDLTSGVSVELVDGRVDERAKALQELSSADAAVQIGMGLLRDSQRELTMGDRRFFSPVDPLERIEANRGDAMVDWLLAAERARGSRAVAEGVRAAMFTDPGLVDRLLQNTRHEPWRQATALRMLRRAGLVSERSPEQALP
jgi:hypothetical protein